jgi:D-lactate dehydrogenase
LTTAFLKHLSSLLDNTRLLTDPADCRVYGYDNSTLQGQPLAVAFPDSHQQVVSIVQACRKHRIALIARGQGTGTTGATVPGADNPTLILSLQRMRQILALNPDNRLMVVEPGVTNQEVQTAAEASGFFWPPDPTSAAVCTVGGNLAYNSAGPRAVKYGTPRENTLGLKAVTGAGETLYTGVKTTKGVVGYDLTRLLIGSEGTLAIITEATLKLTPLQPAKRTLRAFYRDVHSAARAVSAIMAQPVAPCALEFMDGSAIQMVRPEAGDSLPEDAGALLMIEVDGIDSQLDELVECVVAAARVDGVIAVEAARSSEEIAALWSIRKALSPALRRVAPKKINEDVVVPVSRIPELVTKLEELSRQFAIKIVNFGHAGNGNLHVNIMYDPSDSDQLQRAGACLEAVFSAVLQMDGTLSGEHGIGLVKRDWVGRELDDTSLRLMRAIKAQFDPDGILNPGKTLPPGPA